MVADNSISEMASAFDSHPDGRRSKGCSTLEYPTKSPMMWSNPMVDKKRYIIHDRAMLDRLTTQLLYSAPSQDIFANL
jgi:hypothetical protein